MNDVVVRALRMSDEPELLALVREEMVALGLLDARFHPRADAMDRYANYLRDRIREFDSVVFVAESGGKAIGFAVASLRQQVTFFDPARFGTISDLVVAASMRRRGVGTRLLHRMTKWFQDLGVTIVRLHVASCNEPARAFWRAQGAEDYLVETWIDLSREPSAVRSETRVAASGDGAKSDGAKTDGAAEPRRPAAPPAGISWTDDLAGGL